MAKGKVVSSGIAAYSLAWLDKSSLCRTSIIISEGATLPADKPSDHDPKKLLLRTLLNLNTHQHAASLRLAHRPAQRLNACLRIRDFRMVRVAVSSGYQSGEEFLFTTSQTNHQLFVVDIALSTDISREVLPQDD